MIHVLIRSTAILAAGCAAAIALTGCGGDEPATTTVQTVTVAAPPPAPTTDTLANTATTEAEPEPEVEGEPLPDGVIALDGRYAMVSRSSDYDGQNTTVDDVFPTDSVWSFRTRCTAGACSVAMRRELKSGAFKSLTLKPDPERPDVYSGRSTGRTNCATGPDGARTRQRHSVKLNDSEDIGGRRTATVIEVYFTETTTGCGSGGVARGIVSWKGRRQR